MKTHILSFLLGAAFVFGLTTVTASKAAGPNHVYELRVYHAAPGKLDALNARFADRTDAIFKRLNMKSIGYWVPQENADNLLIYILEHPSRAEGEKNWAAFQKDPEWLKVKADSEVNGVLAPKVDRTWMDPVAYSKLK
jgi:hypothetical protein